MPKTHSVLVTALLALTPALTYGDTLLRSGPAEDRLDLVILADGYRNNDRAQFDAEAQKVLNELRTTEPYARYLSLMNVHTGFRASASSGPGQNNAYGTHFAGGLFSSLLRATRTNLLLEDAVRAGGEADVVLVIVKSNRRGGTAYGNLTYVSSGGGPRVALHELGHAIGRLGDEYSSFSGTPTLSRQQLAARYPNLTTANTRETLPWKDWVDSSTRVPAGFFGSGVSAYRGGGAYSSGIYRPRRSCLMRTDGPGFCQVCRQHLTMELHGRARPLHMVFEGSGSSRRARVVSAIPNANWATRWSGVQGSGLAAVVPSGVNAAVVVEDNTPWVRGEHRLTIRYRFNARTGVGGPLAVSGGAGQAGQVVGVNSRLRVRSGPSTGSTIVGHLQPNARVRVLGPAQGGFYPIAFNGGVGYAGRNFIRLTPQSVGFTTFVATCSK